MVKKILFLISLCMTCFMISFGARADEYDAFGDEEYDGYEYEDDDMPSDAVLSNNGGFTDNNITIANNTEQDTIPTNVYLNSGARFVGVKDFDIAGIMLGMSYDEINNLFFSDGGLYAPRAKNSIVYTINNDWKYNLDYECRQNRLVIPEKIEKCINSLARNRGLLYVSEIHLERTFTGETIDVYLTSNATDNVVWKIVYNNDANERDGDSEKFINQREKKILAFWQGVLEKYGVPNSGEDKWISSENAYDPMMRAYFGQLELVDNGLNTTDSAKNIQSAREKFQAKPYAF